MLAGGFGLGVAVMAALLGVGGVILEQAQSPALVGGGDVVIGGVTGQLPSARFVALGRARCRPAARASGGGRLADRAGQRCT